MNHLAFIDTETTGLWPHLGHEPWEVAVIIEGHPDHKDSHLRSDRLDGEYLFQLPVRISAADPMALTIGGYWQRRQANGPDGARWLTDAGRKVEATEQRVHPGAVARLLTRLLDGATWVGANPSFDQGMLTPFLLRHEQAPVWKHRSIDVTTLLAGCLEASGHRVAVPYKSDAISEAAGVRLPVGKERHTAMGDALWVRAQYLQATHWNEWSGHRA